MPKVLVLRGVLRRPDGAYLFLQRSSKSGTWPGFWEFPGGKADPGESASTALKREFVEETGLAVEPEALLAEFEWPREKDIIVYQIHTVRAASFAPVISHEHDAFGWFMPDELKALNISAPLKKVVADLIH